MKSKLHAAGLIDRYWAIQPEFGSNASEMLATIEIDAQHARKEVPTREYEVRDRIAFLTLSGPMMRVPETNSMSGAIQGTSTIELRRALRAAERDSSVVSIALLINSPGGQVSGTRDLVEEVARINKDSKPIRAYIEDMCCSAAYWVASQCESITAGRNAMCIGSIGIFTALVDSSENAEQEGLKVHLISSGGVKGHPMGGVPVPDEVIEDVQAMIDKIYSSFTADVAEGLGVTVESVRKYATGQTWDAEDAKKIGLVHSLADFETFCQGLTVAPISGALADGEMGLLQKLLGFGGPPPTQVTDAELAERKLDGELAAAADSLASSFIDSKISALRDAKKLTKEREDVLRNAYLEALKADGGGDLIFSGGKIVSGSMVASVDAMADGLTALPLGEQVLSNLVGQTVVVVDPNVAATQEKAKVIEAYKAATPKTLGGGK